MDHRALRSTAALASLLGGCLADRPSELDTALQDPQRPEELYTPPTLDQRIAAASQFWQGGRFLYDEFQPCTCRRPENPPQPPGFNEAQMVYAGRDPEVCQPARAAATIVDYTGLPLQSPIRLDFLLRGDSGRIPQICLPLLICQKGLETGRFMSEEDEAYRTCHNAAWSDCQRQGLDDLCRVPDFALDANGSFSVPTEMIGTAIVEAFHPEGQVPMRGEVPVDASGTPARLRVVKEPAPAEYPAPFWYMLKLEGAQ